MAVRTSLIPVCKGPDPVEQEHHHVGGIGQPDLNARNEAGGVGGEGPVARSARDGGQRRGNAGILPTFSGDGMLKEELHDSTRCTRHL
jgi:hypothetical protein